MKFHSDLIKEINFLRKNPSDYAEKILGYKNYFKGNVLKLPGEKAGIGTNEGFAAYEEAAKFLKSTKSVEKLIPSKALGRIAKDYMEKVKACDPDKEEEIDLESIIQKYGSFSGSFSNSMDYGSSTPELVVINLLVCDGDQTRENRNSLVNPELKKIGVASGKDDVYRYVTVIVCCNEFKNTLDKDDNENFDEFINNESKNSQLNKPYSSLVENNNLPKDNEVLINDPNILSCQKREWMVIDNGKRKNKIMYIKKYKDGTIKKEVKYILL